MGKPSPVLLDLPAANHLASPRFVYGCRQPELGALHRAVRTGWPQVKALVQAGAPAVLWNGAPIVLPSAQIQGVPLHYGLGNLRLDQRRPDAKPGQVALIRLRGRQAISLEIRCVDSVAGALSPCLPAPADPTDD